MFGPTLLYATLLTLSVLSRAATVAVNFTIDDASPLVQYDPAPIQHCTRSTCSPEITNLFFNGTNSITEGTIVVPFSGTAVYVFLDFGGACVFNIDGETVATLTSNTNVLTGIGLVYANTSLSAEDHMLVIAPARPQSWIDFDYVIYTALRKRKPPVGAIVGGAVGGAALLAGMGVAGVFLRRRNRRKRLSTRGFVLGEEGVPTAMQMAHMRLQKE
ncbi:hypothetical protein B0H10DRAFT_2208486 [Mycena sp. CBHHK59/15]|nr:hypothetical protein B0H10DRAFT_2208486 [Mycena sp. CBHHK59/15]